MPSYVYTTDDLRQFQALPLEAKVTMSMSRIKDAYKRFKGDMFVSVSGGKDSDVLDHLVHEMYPDVPRVFVDTGLEYPEVRKHALSKPDVVRLTPEKSFKEVLSTYGYPVISKDVAGLIEAARRGAPWATNKLKGKTVDGADNQFIASRFSRYGSLLDAPFLISEKCCGIMKERPVILYERQTGRYPYIGTLACESQRRTEAWLRTGCNAFYSRRPHSTPLSIWTEQDILQYIKSRNLPIASVYGDIIEDSNGKLELTGLKRTGCMFCMFGAQVEKQPNRFQRMKESHPKQYEFCMRPPDENGLGLDAVLSYLKIPH